MAEQKKYKVLPIGTFSYSKLINGDKYFVDKTQYIKNVIEDDGSDVLLLTRPRRFGKTLFMTMLGDFLTINEVNPEDKAQTKELFKDTQIIKDKEFTDKYLASFPVISITLKSVNSDTYEGAYEQLATVIYNVAKNLDYLLLSDRVKDSDKVILKNLSDINYVTNINNKTAVTSALSNLTQFLYDHFNKPVVVLIDEYDVPLAKAALYGYHDKMVNTMSSFLDFLKGPSTTTYSKKDPVYKIVMTGCLKVAKNSIFTGVNNLKVNTVLDKEAKFSSMIGFNKSEVIKMLDDYDMLEYADMVKDNYDGYRFHNDEMFCPWDVVNFLDLNHPLVLNNEKDKVVAGNYWNISSSDSKNFIKDYLGFLKEKDIELLQDLVDGKTLRCQNCL